MAQTTHTTSGQGLAIASLTLGIVTIIISLAWFISILTGALAIIFGAVSLKSAGRGKALAGIITGSVGIVLSVLLIVLVIVAVPALQQNQRDTVRKNDVSTILTDITTYQSNNRGGLPHASDLSTTYLTDISRISDVGTPTADTAVYLVGTNCAGSQVSTRNYSVSILLENGSTYCQDS